MLRGSRRTPLAESRSSFRMRGARGFRIPQRAHRSPATQHRVRVFLRDSFELTGTLLPASLSWKDAQDSMSVDPAGRDARTRKSLEAGLLARGREGRIDKAPKRSA